MTSCFPFRLSDNQKARERGKKKKKNFKKLDRENLPGKGHCWFSQVTISSPHLETVPWEKTEDLFPTWGEGPYCHFLGCETAIAL